MYGDFDLYSRAPTLDEEEEENPLLRQAVAPPYAPPPPEPPPVVEPPPVPEGFIEEPEELPVPEGFVEEPEEPPVPEGFVEEVPEEEPSDLGKFARAVAAPFMLTSPLETVGRMGEALMPEGSRRAEFVDRIKRNFATGMEETKAGTRQMAAGLLRAEQNPYVSKSVAEAEADIPLLEQKIAEAENDLIGAGGDPDLVGQEWSYELKPELVGQSQKIGDLRRQLAYAKEGATGVSTESFAGTFSRSLEDVAAENRVRGEEIIKQYAPLINESRNGELWMQVANSLGSSGPSMGASMMNPLFGLGLMYAQTFDTSRSEFLKKGGDPAKADEYGHTQAVLQTPLEILGELPVAAIAKGALKRLVKEGSPESWAKWIKESAVDLGKAEAGEVGITTPGQTIIEQKVGEEYGVKPKKTWEELQKDVVEAQKVAALQVGIAGGGPLAVEAATRAAAPAPVAPVVTPSGPVAPPPIPPTPPELFAPGVTITPTPGEVPVPPDLVPPPPGVAPPVEPTGDERFAPPVMPTPVEPGQPPTPEGVAVTQQVGAENLVVKEVADNQAVKLQSANAPKTAQAIQQVAQRSNAGATVSAAEFLQQARAQAAEAQAEADEKAAVEAEKVAKEIAKAAPAAAPGAVKPGEFAQPGYTVAAPAPAQAAPEAAPATEYPSAVVVGGQVFTGATHEDATRAAHAAVGPDAMVSSEGGWVDPETGRFSSHEVFETHRDLNTAIEQSGGNWEAPAVQEAQAQLAEAVARDDELNSQIVQPGGEQVIKTGIKNQQALVSVRPSQELAVPLAGVAVSVRGVTPEGQTTTAQRPAAQALNDARNDRTAFQILLNCLL